MSTLQETLDKIATIALGNSAEVQAEVTAVKDALVANTEALAANTANDDATKATVADLTTAFNALVDKLAAAPAPTPAPVDETVVS